MAHNQKKWPMKVNKTHKETKKTKRMSKEPKRMHKKL